MLAKDPVKRDQNRYRYCDNDPADYVDPTGEVANIVGGALLGGGFLSSVVSQKMSGGEIDWWKALGAGINGLITGATQGGLLASGAGIPAALFGNNLAGTAGSAAEQGIGSGKIDPVKSIIDGLSNAVGNRWYKSDGLKSAKDAFKRGAGSGAIISGLNYISDTLFQKPEQRGMGVGLLPGIAGAAFSPYNFLRNPRRGCGSTSPFVPGLGYSSARGYQYDLPKIESGSQSQSKRFSLKDLLLEMVIGGVTGGVSSAAFYGAGKGIERLKDGLRPSRGGRETELFLPEEYYQKMDDNMAKAIAARDAEVARIQGLSKTQQSKVATVVAGVDIRTGDVYVGVKNSRIYKGNATCAEDIVFRGLGGNANANIIMTSAVRPKNNEVIPVCLRCQTKYPQNQFMKGTVFQ
jgi:hypothetical protein